MLHSVYGINDAQLNAATATLQRMQDNPEALQRSMRRFDPDDPPPPYSSGGSTESATPTFMSLRQPTAQERNELVRRPLDDEELEEFSKCPATYVVEYPYRVDSEKEQNRIRAAWRAARDEWGRSLFRGPDLTGRPGTQRGMVMIRNGIRKRWEKLGVWNPEWGIPGRVDPENPRKMSKRPEDDTDNWRWPWTKPDTEPPPPMPPFPPVAEPKWTWPPRHEESVDLRAIREHLERKGEWTGPQASSDSEAASTTQVDEDCRITSRPWYQWQLEIQEEEIRLKRLWRVFGIPNPNIHRYERETVNVMERWKARGDWKDSWGKSPGWKWRHESPSPEPEDPDEMDFSPSEIDALESIRPATPPQPLKFKVNPAEEEAARLFFSPLALDDPARLALTQRSENRQETDENGADGTEAVDDGPDRSQSHISDPAAPSAHQQSREALAPRRNQRPSRKSVRFEPDESLLLAQDHLFTRRQTRSPRKRKRDDEIDVHTLENSPPLELQPEPRQQKRARTSRSTSQLPRQSARAMELGETVANDQSPTKKRRARPSMEQSPPEPRRSARIAKLQKAGAKLVQSAKPGVTLRRKDSMAPHATQLSKRSGPKRSETLSRADNQHTGRGENGAGTRARSGRRPRSS